MGLGYYNYHAKIKEKIKDGKLVSFKIVDKWNSISPALVLFFSDGTTKPIREYRWEEYFELFKSME